MLMAGWGSVLTKILKTPLKDQRLEKNLRIRIFHLFVKTGAAERRLGSWLGSRVTSRKPPVGRMFRLIPAVIDQTHLSFQRGQEAWLAEFEKWWARRDKVRP